MDSLQTSVNTGSIPVVCSNNTDPSHAVVTGVTAFSLPVSLSPYLWVNRRAGVPGTRNGKPFSDYNVYLYALQNQKRLQRLYERVRAGSLSQDTIIVY
jgi:hypothetical protein